MLQSKVIHRPGFCAVFSNGIQKRQPKFCHVLIVAQVCLWSGSSRHLTTASSCMQTHTQPGHARTVACTKSDLPSRLGYKCARTSGANRGHLRTRTQIRRVLPHLQPGQLLPACSHQPSANRRVNIATSCRGGDANRHQAQSGHTGTTVCFCSLLNTLLSVSIQTEIQM